MTTTSVAPVATTTLDVRWLGRMAYLPALELQREVHAARVAGEVPDTVLLVEHEPVYTAGKRTQPGDRPVPGPGVPPVVEVDRGGKITWHGPGQLVGYPILALPDPVDVVAHVRRMESLLVDVCAQLGLATVRVEGRSGVWVAADPTSWPPRPERKVAAIGVRVARGVTLHGFALNCDPDLGGFGAIVPCGIPDAGVTSLSAELGRTVSLDEVRPLVEARLPRLRTVVA